MAKSKLEKLYYSIGDEIDKRNGGHSSGCNDDYTSFNFGLSKGSPYNPSIHLEYIDCHPKGLFLVYMYEASFFSPKQTIFATKKLKDVWDFMDIINKKENRRMMEGRNDDYIEDQLKHAIDKLDIDVDKLKALTKEELLVFIKDMALVSKKQSEDFYEKWEEMKYVFEAKNTDDTITNFQNLYKNLKKGK